jgi:glycosyltransferase involved in cell wall biosynthesis
LKILHVISSPRAEGTVRLVLDWLRTGLHEQGVCALSATPAELTEQLRAAAAWYVEEPRIPTGKAKFPWMVRRLRRLCLQKRPDMVISWNNGFGAFVLLGARLAGVRHLLTHAGNPVSSGLKGRLYTVFTTAVLAMVGGKMVCCSRYVRQSFQQSPGAINSVLRMAPNCSDLESVRVRATQARASRAHDGRKKRLLMVATLEGHKDHATLLRAIAQAGKVAQDWEVLLAGEGALRSPLEALARELGLDTVVHFLGSRDDVPELLGSADVFVFSTTPQEGLGTVLIEALAAGTRIVASDVPACREALQDGKWGELVVPANPAALARTIVSATQNVSWCPPAGVDGYLQQYRPEHMMRCYLLAAGAGVPSGQ